MRTETAKIIVFINGFVAKSIDFLKFYFRLNHKLHGFQTDCRYCLYFEV